MQKSVGNSIVFQLIIIQFMISGFSFSDITNNAFGSINDGIIAAFGDFNSDELTDVFLLTNNSRTLEILFGADRDPLLRRSTHSKCEFHKFQITSVVPGDFDGDAFMDLMIVTKQKNDSDNRYVYINWGGSEYLNCTDESSDALIKMHGEPVALDYNKDMIIDLFGCNKDKERMFWIFNKERKSPHRVKMKAPNQNSELRIPHAHAYLDLDNDFTADLFVSTETGFEIWHGLEDGGFEYSQSIVLPISVDGYITGQSIFLDMELNGHITHIFPICYDENCSISKLLAYRNGTFKDLNISFKDNTNQEWRFIPPNRKLDQIYQNTITLRGGDFNLDGYPDLLATLTPASENHPQTFLMENVACDQCGAITRTFQVRWKAFAPFTNGTVMGAFYDFYQDGILDVIFIEKRGDSNYKPLAFRNTLDYDANFVKVIVLTGLNNSHNPTELTPLGRKKRTYGTNLPGPRIAYYTTKQDGDRQESSSVQIPQSAYFSLHLPFTIFGLGRTPNFVDSLTVGLSNRTRTWTQLIPNSQMVVVPWPLDDPSRWKAQLFVTPSKLIWMSVLSLSATCVVIMLIILILHIKELREDKLERSSDTERLHFNSM